MAIQLVQTKPSFFLNIIHGTVQQLTENNESESVIFSLKDLWTSNVSHGFAIAFVNMNTSSW